VGVIGEELDQRAIGLAGYLAEDIGKLDRRLIEVQ
jgi:hypothetical protein